MKFVRLCILAVAVILLQGVVQVASADNVTGTLNLGATNFDANGSLTTTGANWSFTMDFVNGTANTVDLNSFAVQLFNAGASEAFSLASAKVNGVDFGNGNFFEAFADDKVNNGGTPDCSTSSVKGWLCADTGQVTLHPFAIDSGKTAEFIFSGTFTGTSAISPLDLMASGCLVAGTCKLDGGDNNLNKWAVSGSMTTTTTTTPEPSSLLLLGSGLIGLFARKRLKA